MKESVQTDRPSLGVLHLKDSETIFRLSRYVPSPDIAFFVKHYWIVSWDLTGQEPHLQEVVPNPCVNLVVEPGKTAIYGPAKSKFSYLLHGKGFVFGVKFKPGGFYPFTGKPVSELLERPLSLQEVFGEEAAAAESAILAQTDDEAMVELAERLIRPKLPPQDGNIRLVNQIVDRISQEADLTKVGQLVEQFGVNKRKLQRLFDQYVGVSPKWVIKLYRLQNAAEMMDRGLHLDRARLSTDLGYFDQSHFIKDFKAVIGQTPEEYANAKRSSSG